jgi:hypothetical protein
MPQIRQYWLSILKRGLSEASQFMALHKFWMALAPVILAPFYLGLMFGVRGVTDWWKIALSAAMGYATAFVFALLWKLIVIPAAVQQEKADEVNAERDKARKSKTEKETAERKLADLRESTSKPQLTQFQQEQTWLAEAKLRDLQCSQEELAFLRLLLLHGEIWEGQLADLRLPVHLVQKYLAKFTRSLLVTQHYDNQRGQRVWSVGPQFIEPLRYLFTRPGGPFAS